jgi:hypothetical protein
MLLDVTTYLLAETIKRWFYKKYTVVSLSLIVRSITFRLDLDHILPGIQILNLLVEAMDHELSNQIVF